MSENRAINGGGGGGGRGEVLITISGDETPRANATPKGSTSKEADVVVSGQNRTNSPMKESDACGFLN